jgi:hypothetical protein
MSLPHVVSRDDWVAARRELLAKEKELTRQRDALNAERRRLPMVRIEKDYVFEGPDGKATLPALFDGRRQPAGGLGGAEGSCVGHTGCGPRLLGLNGRCGAVQQVERGSVSPLVTWSLPDTSLPQT